MGVTAPQAAPGVNPAGVLPDTSVAAAPVVAQALPDPAPPIDPAQVAPLPPVPRPVPGAPVPQLAPPNQARTVRAAPPAQAAPGPAQDDPDAEPAAQPAQYTQGVPPPGPGQAPQGPPAAKADSPMSAFGGAVTRFGDMLQLNGLVTNPLVEGGAAIGTSILAMCNVPIIGTIISSFYCLGHLCKFLGNCMSGKFDWGTLRELGGALLTGCAAAASAVCPALGMVNGAALAADMGLGILYDASHGRDPYAMGPLQPQPSEPPPGRPQPQPQPPAQPAPLTS